jgi:LmbE family N-acetylglucosaminyl deacetylase
VITATRPISEETVKEIYSFEIPSSTEWSYPLSFSPDIFYDISKTIDVKIKALEKYKTELKEFPHPRSLEGVKLITKNWGMKVGLNYAEAFKCVRIIK